LYHYSVVGCCPSPTSLRELVRASRGSLRRLELCIESGAVDPYSYDPSAAAEEAGGGSGGSGALGGVVVDASVGLYSR
jgi:hypothetical protein